MFIIGCGGSQKYGMVAGDRIAIVTRTDLQRKILATGNIQPHASLSLFPALTGRIEKILVKEGDLVRKGQLLMELSSTERAAMLDEAAAQGASQLAHWEQSYQETPLLSPENGQIIYLPTVPGQVISTGVTVLVMSDHLMANAQVDETDLSQVNLGQKAIITLDAYPDKPVQGTVKRISYFSVKVNNVTAYEVDVGMYQVPTFIRSGMTANVAFQLSDKKSVLVIPTSGLRQADDKKLFVLKAPSNLNAAPMTQWVDTGLSDGKNLEIISGLSEGDRILVSEFSAAQLMPQVEKTNPFIPSPPKTKSQGGKGGGVPPRHRYENTEKTS